MFHDLPASARWYIVTVVSAGAAALILLLPRGELTPVLPFLLLVLLSSLTSAFKVHFPIASGSSMSVSYVVDIASLILRGPHATMIVGAASGWSQTTFNTQMPQPAYRTLFNMACLALTVEAAGQVYERLGGTAHVELTASAAVPLGAMALTYYFANTLMIATAVALSTSQRVWHIWKTEFASSAQNYLLGALTAAVVIQVTAKSRSRSPPRGFRRMRDPKWRSSCAMSLSVAPSKNNFAGRRSSKRSAGWRAASLTTSTTFS